MKNKINIFIIFAIFALLMPAKRVDPENGVGRNFSSGSNGLFRIGEYGYPTNPMNDRAKGFSIQGKVKNTVLNYGNFIDWDYNPSGGWGEYAYLPNVSFMAGVPGHISSAEYNWESVVLDDIVVWASSEAYQAWAESTNEYNGEPNRFSSIVYNVADDRGDIGLQRLSVDDFGRGRFECSISGLLNEADCESNYTLIDGSQVYGVWSYSDLLDMYAKDAIYEWVIDTDNNSIYIYMLDEEADPNFSSSRIGLAFPWGFRPKLENRFDEYDRYDYGEDQEEWTDDDFYDFYGATTSESWFSRWSPKTNSDWHASTASSLNTHSTQFNAGDLFGNTQFTGSSDSYPLLAHSNYLNTWPSKLNSETFEDEPYWPGWYADEYYGDDPDLWESAGINVALCAANQTRTNPECWKELPGRFISDSDIYMSFDDRWAHRANTIDSNNEYEQTGYPLGLTVQSMAHSYGVSYAEDIMFVTVKVRNESGDYANAFMRDKNGDKEFLLDADGNYISGEGLVMPDGTKLNAGNGFNYEKMALGFYMDADVLMGNLEGYNSALHTNNDDFMEYYDCKTNNTIADDLNPWLGIEGNEENANGNNCPIDVDGEELRISFAMIYDEDGESGGVTGFSKDEEPGGGGLGIVATQLLDSPYATTNVDLDSDGFVDLYPGDKLKMTDWHWFDWYNRPGVVSREGDNNCCAGDPGKSQAKNKEAIQYKLLAGDKSDISANEDEWFFHDENNYHQDDASKLVETSFYLDGPEGLDCVFIMSCAPFNLDVGEEVNFSFCILFGENRKDLLRNAKFAQIMYNAHYQGYTAPRKPKVAVTANHSQVKIHWTNSPEKSKDVITGYTDFEGYKIYKSLDGGSTWGNATSKIYDDKNTFSGWLPYQQFDLSAAQDSSFCITGFIEKCYISGQLNEEYTDKNGCEANDGLWNHYFDENQNGQWNLGESYNCVSSIVVDPDTGQETLYSTRDISIEGPDPEAPWFTLGENSGFDSIVPCNCASSSFYTQEDCEGGGFIWECDKYNDGETVYDYTFIDNNVIDGYEYTYSVTAYDTGVMSDRVILTQDENGEWTQETISVPDPNEWGALNAFQLLENSKGTTEFDDNFVKIIPGYAPQTDWSLVNVVPNPFILHSNYETNDYQLKWMITGLPLDCTIKIFTVTGELVNEFRHTSSTGAFDYWDLRNKNNQEIAPGLYFYTIEDLTQGSKLEPYVGKFVIIR